MTKSFASLLLIAGAVSLAGACSSTDNGLPGNTSGTGNNTSGTGNFAGSIGQPTAGASSYTAGATGTAGSGGASAAGGSAGNTAGGITGTAGSGTAGSGTGGAVNPGDGPAGYYVEKDWHGCAWTGKEASGATTIAPMDFVAKPPADAFCVKGSVGPTYESVALLGFNVGEPPPASCAYKAADSTAAGPPAVAATGEGLAINFVKQGTNTAFTLRVQIQGPNGHKEGTEGAADRWCATITEVQGKIFVPYTSFTPECWKAEGMRGTAYNKQAISAVVFNVPGVLSTATPYDFCVNGFTHGTMASEAPDGPAVAGDQTGVVGSAGPDGDFERAKVVVAGEEYIIQNNNWGNLGGELILNYTNNSFKLTSGSGSGGDAPASFPSIYIGNNGNTKNGVYSTKATDNLPIQIKNITSLPSTFRYSGGTAKFNAAYDIWFANSIPTTEYKDGIDGFVMVWLRDPSGKQPIGYNPTNPPTAMVAGIEWNVHVGKRGGGGPNANATVVNFVNQQEDVDTYSQSFKDVDLKAFFTAAQGYGISPDMYLTDVFAGFEIWEGGAGGNLAVDEFKAVVNK